MALYLKVSTRFTKKTAHDGDANLQQTGNS